jgi:uncharacterized protein (DUF1800 family)
MAILIHRCRGRSALVETFFLCAIACRSANVGPPELAAGAGPRELTPVEQARQALSRLSFGPRPGEVSRVAAAGVDRWIAWQLYPDSIADSVITRLQSMETQRKSAADLIADHPTPQEIQALLQRRSADSGLRVPSMEDSAALRHAQQVAGALGGQVLAAKTLRAVASERQLLEVVTDFWENHFSVFAGKMPTPYAVLEYDRDVIRPRALGKFRELLGAVAKSPAMLYYLDNWQSAVDSLHANVPEERLTARRAASSDPTLRALAALPHRRPRGLNENYGRELLELHTLGVDGGYTQQDVINVARAFTGWTIDVPQLGGGFTFRPELHDAEEKVVLGHTLAAGRGIEDGEEVLDILAASPATARFIATKLARRFVQDEPPPPLIKRCAGVFQRTGGDIRETLRCVVSSREFFSRAAYRAKIKTPFELVASAVRAMSGEADTTPRLAQLMARLGQPVFGHLTPDGWPDRASAWLNPGSLLNRINFGSSIVAGQVPGVRLAAWAPAAKLRNATREEQVRVVVDELLGGNASPETMQLLLSGSNPAANERSDPRLSGLAGVVGLALSSPEFQRRE